MILLPFRTFSVAYITVSKRGLDSKTTCLPSSIFVKSHLTWSWHENNIIKKHASRSSTPRPHNFPYGPLSHEHVVSSYIYKMRLDCPLLQSGNLQNDGNNKPFWRWHAGNSGATVLPDTFNCSSWNSRPVDIYFSFKHFSLHHIIPWKCSDPSRSSQGIFSSSAFQTLASLPGNNWSLCWSYFRTYCGCLLDVSTGWSLEYLSLRISGEYCIRYNFVRSVSVDNDCDKRGQTSRPFVATEIQTSCNFEANLRDHCLHVGFAHCHNNNVLLGFPYNLVVNRDRGITVPSNLNHRLHKDFPNPSSSSSSVTRPVSTTEPNKSTEHSEIQKGSVQCTLVATDTGSLLSSPRFSGGFGP